MTWNYQDLRRTPPIASPPRARLPETYELYKHYWTTFYVTSRFDCHASSAPPRETSRPTLLHPDVEQEHTTSGTSLQQTATTTRPLYTGMLYMKPRATTKLINPHAQENENEKRTTPGRSHEPTATKREREREREAHKAEQEAPRPAEHTN